MVQYVFAMMGLFKDRRAVTSLEYGLIASVILAVIFAGFVIMANALSNQFVGIGNSL